ncbi:hypothetical protein IE077_004257 [Cardiosporidium cionae]|uniref:Kinesin motor domain-containing protein n=1 Tax=Cardiosporidium cionae TaxID=476202 RepID=A0ABQ7J5E7_9APIC|nr:hypothetical protein IE077_004257 [Cardiosporidium cionae]|eukprot:KAF8819201.1 hypothetical protein IE077_004257 [Cardiosporidium cionae]
MQRTRNILPQSLNRFPRRSQCNNSSSQLENKKLVDLSHTLTDETNSVAALEIRTEGQAQPDVSSFTEIKEELFNEAHGTSDETKTASCAESIGCTLFPNSKSITTHFQERCIENSMFATFSSSNAPTEKCRSIPTIPSETLDTTDTSIQVICRIRPLETTSNSNNFIPLHPYGCTRVVDSSTIELLLSQSDQQTTSFSPGRRFFFDSILQPSTSQHTVFEKVAIPYLDAVFSGFNATLIAYGQTNSGKTHTLLGLGHSNPISASLWNTCEYNLTPPEWGLLPRMIVHIFSWIESTSQSVKVSLRLSILEIYNEIVNDLLTGQTNLRIYPFLPSQTDGISQELQDEARLRICKGDDSKVSFFVKDLSEQSVENADEVFNLLSNALINRKVASTNSNNKSSRSHLIFCLDFEQRNLKNGEYSSLYLTIEFLLRIQIIR